MVSKEWCERMARLEGDAEIGAGPLALDPGWQPIALAPRDVPLLVWHPGLGMGGWNVMRFDGNEWRETANDGRALKAGYEPSHWMRLPSPPTDQPTNE